MDPSVDSEERFMVFASNRPSAVANSNDIFIVFQKDGKWGEPVSLGETVNSPALENAPSLAPDGKTLYLTSNRPNLSIFPKKKENFVDVTKRLLNVENGSRNIWRVDISDLLKKYLKS